MYYFMMKKFLSFFALASIALASQATDLTVFDGTDQNQYIPFRATYFDWSPYYGQVIFPASELAAMSGQDITSMKFYVANENGNVMNNGELSFYLCETTQNAFSNWSTELIPTSDFKLVAAVPMTYGDSEIVVNFDAPFAYQGGNLAVMASVTQVGSYSAEGYFYGVNSTVSGAAYGASVVNAQQFYPKTTFTYGADEPQPQWQLGDVNHDKSVDVSDVTAIISYILGNNPENFYLTEANVDMDAEGAIDVSDVTAVIAIILGSN